MIGQKVKKKSGKPFKSTFKVNTVKGIIPHPILTGEEAYTFEEDDSYVSVAQCKSSETEFPYDENFPSMADLQ